MEIKKIIDAYFKNYESIIERYYPAHGKNGFTERNMTNRFGSTTEELYKDKNLFVWYEAPIPDQNKNHTQHMDAVIFDQNENSIYLVESKRFSNTTDKINALGEDINRMHSPEVVDTVCKGWKNKQKGFSTVYGVVLADVWPDETAGKGEIYKSWKKGTFLKDNREKLKLNPEIFPTYYRTHKYPVRDFNHALLAMVFKIK